MGLGMCASRLPGVDLTLHIPDAPVEASAGEDGQLSQWLGRIVRAVVDLDHVLPRHDEDRVLFRHDLRSTAASGKSLIVQRAKPAGGSVQASAISRACCSPSKIGAIGGVSRILRLRRVEPPPAWPGGARSALSRMGLQNGLGGRISCWPHLAKLLHVRTHTGSCPVRGIRLGAPCGSSHSDVPSQAQNARLSCPHADSS